MTEKRRKQIVIAALPLAIIWAWFNLGGDNTASEDKYKVATIQPLTNPKADNNTAVRPSLDTLRLSEANWGLSPFKTVIRNRKAASQSVTNFNWSLTGIMHNAVEPMAYINRKIVKVGDQVDRAQVVKIDKSSVTIKYNDEFIKLSLSKG